MAEKQDDKASIDEIDALRKDLKKMRSDFEGLLKSWDEGDHSGEGVLTEIGEALTRLRHRFDSLQSQAKKMGSQSVANMEQRIQDRPFQSAAIAFVAGLIFGYLMDRRMHH